MDYLLNEETEEIQEDIDIKKAVIGIFAGIVRTAVIVGGMFFYLVKVPVKIVQQPALITVESMETENDERSRFSHVIMPGDELPSQTIDLSEKITVHSDYELGQIEMPDTKTVIGYTVPAKYKVKEFNYTVSYASTDENVLTVDENGVVSVHSNGFAQVNISSGDIRTTVDYIVNKAVTPQSMPEEATVFVGETKEFISVGDYEIIINPFISENGDVATVTENGLLCGISQGSTTVSTTLSNGETAYTRIRVLQPITEIQVSAVKCYQGGSTKVNVKLLPSGADFGTNLKYDIADTSIAKVDDNGTVTGLKKGSTTITVTSENGVVGSAILTVTDATPRALSQGKQPTTSTQGNYETSNPAVKAALGYVGKKRKSVDVAEAAAKAYGKTGWKEGSPDKDGVITRTLTCENFITIGTQTAPDNMQPGDIIYWKNGGDGNSHVAVYIGDGMAVHGNWTRDGTTKIASAFYREPTTVIRLK